MPVVLDVLELREEIPSPPSSDRRAHASNSVPSSTRPASAPPLPHASSTYPHTRHKQLAHTPALAGVNTARPSEGRWGSAPFPSSVSCLCRACLLRWGSSYYFVSMRPCPSETPSSVEAGPCFLEQKMSNRPHKAIIAHMVSNTASGNAPLFSVK